MLDDAGRVSRLCYHGTDLGELCSSKCSYTARAAARFEKEKACLIIRSMPPTTASGTDSGPSHSPRG
jgi:hypothetical protein